MVRVSWDRGSFWVKSDDHAYIIIYIDTEATFSHVQLATFEGSAPYMNLGTGMKDLFAKKSFNTKHHKAFMVHQRGGTWQSLLIILLLAACSPSNHTEFSAPFELSSFLKNHIQELPGQTVKFQILDPDGEPIPHDLLRFEWVEGGWMSFQTEQNGTLTMQFEKDMLENVVMVSAKSKDAKIRVTW